jgi:DNA (cytosine-5)-methyltransferase 1
MLSFLEPLYQTRAGEQFRLIKGTPWIARTVVSGGRGWSSVYPLEVPCESSDLASVFDHQFLISTSWRHWDDGLMAPMRVVDLFSGCGGLSLGVREACSSMGRGFEPLLVVDNDPRALAVYQRNFEPTSALGDDIASILDGPLGSPPTASELLLRRKLGPVDALLAGPPCQGHSDLNNQSRRQDPRNRLYERVGRFAEIVNPEHILIENVPAIVHDSDGSLQTTIDLLRRVGYKIDEGLIDLFLLGVPQRRKRHVVLASLSKNVEISAIIDKYSVPMRDLRWAIGDLEDVTSSVEFERPSRLSTDNERRVQYLFDKDLYDLPNDQRPPCHQNGEHSYKSMYGRLRWEEPAQTITSGFGSPGQGRFVHPSRQRTLTPREAARLQFFPDSFDFSGVVNRTALSTMIGNAVPMRLSYVFFLDLLSSE